MCSRLLTSFFALLLSGTALAETAGSAPASTPPASLANAPAAAASTASAPTATVPQGLDHEVQDLKQQVLDLNRDLFVLQEDLLFPANTQVAVFVSIDVGTFFNLDSLKLSLDGQEVSSYLYTTREAEALLQGGVQRVYVGNLKVGQHELVAVFTGKGSHQRDYRRGTTLKLDKGISAKFVELKISDVQHRQEPEFVTRVWE
jgi:hypothetical protein